MLQLHTTLARCNIGNMYVLRKGLDGERGGGCLRRGKTQDRDIMQKDIFNSCSKQPDPSALNM